MSKTKKQRQAEAFDRAIAIKLAERDALLPKVQSRADLQAERDRAVSLLREVEWAGVAIDHDGCTEPVCPVCGYEQIVGHKNDCRFRAFLAEVDHG